jgi:hypothetical protein
LPFYYPSNTAIFASAVSNLVINCFITDMYIASFCPNLLVLDMPFTSPSCFVIVSSSSVSFLSAAVSTS